LRPGKVGTARQPRHLLKRFTLAACLAALTLATGASPTTASVTIGQLAPSNPPVSNWGNVDLVQPTVTSGNPYVVPADGTIISWTHNAGSTVGVQMLTMKVFRKIAALAAAPRGIFQPVARYTVVGHDGPRPLAAPGLHLFSAGIAVKAGDVLGLNCTSPAPTACGFPVPGESGLLSGSIGNGAADGQSEDFGGCCAYRLNVSAVFVPSNAFTIGKAKLNKKNGTATLTLNVPNPGALTGSGKGVKVAVPAGAVISKTVSAPGMVKLTIKAKGKKRTMLNETGKVKVKPTITYTPTGGDPATQSVKVKLKKAL
jgi:hypothetical protein